MSSELVEVSKFELARRDKISTLEKVLMDVLVKQPEAEVTTSVHHHFAPQIYIREFFGPKDSVVVSRVHKDPNLFILAKGHVKIVSTTQKKEQVDVFKDFAICTTPANTKRVGYFLEDTIILTVHPNPDDSRDIEELESRIAIDSFEENVA